MNIVATISENCRRFPDKTAVSFKGNRLTYGELGERSKSIAAYLSQLGFYRKCIAIQTDDLIEHVAAILGCLLSGNYYLPVSEDNIWYIDEHFPIPIAAKLVTTATGRQEEHVILAHLPPAPAAWQPAAINEADNMYVLITSGSSGRPKVVVHNYKNINEDICRQIADNNITTADRVDLLFSLTFSASVSCLYTALVAGAELCIYSIRQQGIAGLIPFWEQMKITYATISVSVFVALCKLNDNMHHLVHMRSLGLGTEAVTETAINCFKSHLPKTTRLKIAYASTETRTMAQGIFPNNETLTFTGTVGKVVAGKTIEIVNDEGLVLPTGQTGTVRVTSAYIASGYMGSNHNYNDAFSSAGPLTRYITGDLGYLDHAGNLYIKGRKSATVKVNGIAIDLQLVEDVLSRNPALERVAVVANATHAGRPSLVAFFQSADAGITIDQINACIPAKLPASHYPNFFCRLDALPLTHSGKVDRKQLEEMEYTALHNNSVAAHLENSVMTDELIAIFNRVLHTDLAAAHTSFYTDLGGDSLLSMVVLTEIERRLQIKAPVYSIWMHPTPGQLATYLSAGMHERKTHFHYANNYTAEKRNLYLVNRFKGYNDYKFLINSRLAEKFNLVHLLHDLDEVDNIDDAVAVMQSMSEIVGKQSPQGDALILGLSFNGFIGQQVAAICPQIKECILLDTYNYFEIGSYHYTRPAWVNLANIGVNAAKAADMQLLTSFIGRRLSRLTGTKAVAEPALRPERKNNFWPQYYITAAANNRDAIPGNCIMFRATRTFETHPTHGRNWKKHTRGRFSLFHVKCRHREMTTEENSKTIVAGILKTIV